MGMKGDSLTAERGDFGLKNVLERKTSMETVYFQSRLQREHFFLRQFNEFFPSKSNVHKTI